MLKILGSLTAIFIIVAGTEIISVQNQADLFYENPLCNQQYGEAKVSKKCITSTCARHVKGTC